MPLAHFRHMQSGESQVRSQEGPSGFLFRLAITQYSDLKHISITGLTWPSYKMEADH